MSAGLGRRPARAAPRSGDRESWLCTGRPASVEASESPRLETAPRPAAARSRPAHTTRPLRAPEVPSRFAGSLPERGEVSPFVVRVERHTVVSSVGSVDLTRAVAGEKSTKRLVNERGIAKLGARLPRRRKQLLVDCGAYPDARYAMVIPHMWRERGIMPVGVSSDPQRRRNERAVCASGLSALLSFVRNSLISCLTRWRASTIRRVGASLSRGSRTTRPA